MKVSVILALALSVLAASAAARGELDVRNGVAAIVNDTIITFQEIEAFTFNQIEALRRAYAGQPEVFQQKRHEVLGEGLEQLLERQLVLDDFKNLGGQLPESVIDDEIRDRIRKVYGDRAKLALTLKAQGRSFESLRQETREEIIINYMRQRNVAAGVLVSPEKIERYYQTNLNQYRQGDQVKARLLVLNRPTSTPVEETRQLAADIFRKLKEGAAFAEMATLYSEGSQRREGGDLGWIERTKLNKGLSEIAFALALDEPSLVIALANDPENGYWIYQYDAQGRIQTARQYTARDQFVAEKKPVENPADAAALPPPREFYLIMVEDKRLARTLPVGEVREQIERDLMIQERERLRKKWVERLKAKSFVRYF